MQHKTAGYQGILRVLRMQLMSCDRLQGTMTGQATAGAEATPPHHVVAGAIAVVAHLQDAGAATAGQLPLFSLPSHFTVHLPI